MRPRQDITEMFSSFIQLENDRFSGWLTNIQLRTNMQNCLESYPEASQQQNFWALYWHKGWEAGRDPDMQQSNSFAKMHLLAYLQEPCYQVSNRMVALATNSVYGIGDYFQMAYVEFETILKTFNPRKSSGLKQYFNMALKSRLRDILRKQKEADFCSDWALLRKVTKKCFVEALKNAGLSAVQIGEYRLALTCFKELYTQNQATGTKTLPQPTSQLWQKIANLYNNYRHQLSQTSSECTGEAIETWMNQAVTYVRSYLFPYTASLYTFNANSDTNQTLDLPDDSPSSLDDIIALEEVLDRQEQTSRMLSVLSESLKNLDQETQKVLQLYYQEGRTQQQIAPQLQMGQATVSRRLAKGTKSLLNALVKWRLDVNISVDPNQIKDIDNALEELLTNCFGDIIQP